MVDVIYLAVLKRENSNCNIGRWSFVRGSNCRLCDRYSRRLWTTDEVGKIEPAVSIEDQGRVKVRKCHPADLKTGLAATVAHREVVKVQSMPSEKADASQLV